MAFLFCVSFLVVGCDSRDVGNGSRMRYRGKGLERVADGQG